MEGTPSEAPGNKTKENKTIYASVCSVLLKKICSDILPYSIDSESICEAQLFKPRRQIPKTCQISLIVAKEYNVQELSINYWLIALSETLPVTIKCKNREIKTELIDTSSLLILQSNCQAFIGNTRVQSKRFIEKYQNVTYKYHPVTIPFTCCQNMSKRSHLPDLKPLKVNKIDMEDFITAQRQFDQYSEDLNRLINQPFIQEHLPWFTVFTIVLLCILIILYVMCKCRRKRLPSITMTSAADDPSFPQRAFPRRTKLRLPSILARRRPSIHPGEETEDELMELRNNPSKVNVQH